MGEKAFDLREVTTHLLKASASDKKDVTITEYILAWKELNKMFPLLSRLFSFVQSDVTDKIHILEQYLAGPQKDNFKSVISMVDYELSIGNTESTKPPSASRTLLRLHRAMEYIVQLINDVHDAKETDKMAPVASKAYDDTLANHHPWLIRKGVHLAVHTLGHRKDLIDSMTGHLAAVDTEEAMVEMVTAAHEVYNRVQAIYTEKKLLNLP